ncbi:MAG: DNA N-6-adenine-methyltransferase [Candidatus Binataceae bacterium]
MLGAIDLDPASNRDAQKIIQAKRFFTKDDEGLTKQWRGRMWLNPPYSAELIRMFIDKLIAEFEAGRVTEAIVLVNDCTEDDWFQSLAQVAHVMFMRKRISFWRSGDDEANSPFRGNAIFYLGPKPDKFFSVFAEMAYCVKSAT